MSPKPPRPSSPLLRSFIRPERTKGNKGNLVEGKRHLWSCLGNDFLQVSSGKLLHKVMRKPFTVPLLIVPLHPPPGPKIPITSVPKSFSLCFYCFPFGPKLCTQSVFLFAAAEVFNSTYFTRSPSPRLKIFLPSGFFLFPWFIARRAPPY